MQIASSSPRPRYSPSRALGPRSHRGRWFGSGGRPPGDGRMNPQQQRPEGGLRAVVAAVSTALSTPVRLPSPDPPLLDAPHRLLRQLAERVEVRVAEGPR